MVIFLFLTWTYFVFFLNKFIKTPSQYFFDFLFVLAFLHHLIIILSLPCLAPLEWFILDSIRSFVLVFVFIHYWVFCIKFCIHVLCNVMYVFVYIYIWLSLSLCVTVILMCKTHRTNEKQQRVEVSGLPYIKKKVFDISHRKEGRMEERIWLIVGREAVTNNTIDVKL